LADFFYAWQQLEPSPFTQHRHSTRHPQEVQDVSAEAFAVKLRAVLGECCRVLKHDGLLAFSYHHSRSDGWTALAHAVLNAGLTFVNSHPVKAEMSVAAPKSQAKSPIQLDVILVCRKRALDSRKGKDRHTAFAQAVQHATAKARRLRDCGLALSANDCRVILISQFLVEACAVRSAEQLADLLSSSLTDLDMAAVRLLQSGSVCPVAVARPDERQLALFETPQTK
jgi:adenine-specific DNA methylase